MSPSHPFHVRNYVSATPVSFTRSISGFCISIFFYITTFCLLANIFAVWTNIWNLTKTTTTKCKLSRVPEHLLSWIWGRIAMNLQRSSLITLKDRWLHTQRGIWGDDKSKEAFTEKYNLIDSKWSGTSNLQQGFIYLFIFSYFCL